MAMDIINSKVNELNGLLSKIEIGGKVYEIKDLIARQGVGTLSVALDQVAADLAALSYVKATGVYADDAAVKGAIDAAAKAAKDYTDAQVGAINKFDVHVMQPEEVLPTAAAETMYVLYLKPDGNAESGAYVEYITVRAGEEGAYTYAWEAIGSTKMDVTGFVTYDALAEELKKYHTVEEAHSEHEAIQKAVAEGDNAIIESLGALAHKDNATGTVAGQTISGVKATGQSAGTVSFFQDDIGYQVEASGSYTPVGSVMTTVVPAGTVDVKLGYSGTEATLAKSDYTPAGSVSANFSHETAAASLVMSSHAPEGTVNVSVGGGEFKAITGVGSQASFTEGAFTPATLTKEDVTANYATEGIVGTVNDDECLVFTAAGIAAITASKVNGFTGGAKEADKFVANDLPTMVDQKVEVSAAFVGTAHDCVTGVNYDKASLSDLTFTGTKVEGALVTGVTYDKAAVESQTFTGQSAMAQGTFFGSPATIAVSGNTAKIPTLRDVTFNPADIELAVGDIAVAAKEVTVQ
jgi:hypothetical protein